jgi:tellurium resistance protein TerD
MARYDLTEDASVETAMVFGELYRHGAEWKFRAIGQGYSSGLAGIAQDYGVSV